MQVVVVNLVPPNIINPPIHFLTPKNYAHITCQLITMPLHKAFNIVYIAAKT